MAQSSCILFVYFTSTSHPMWIDNTLHPTEYVWNSTVRVNFPLPEIFWSEDRSGQYTDKLMWYFFRNLINNKGSVRPMTRTLRDPNLYHLSQGRSTPTPSIASHSDNHSRHTHCKRHKANTIFTTPRSTQCLKTVKIKLTKRELLFPTFRTNVITSPLGAESSICN